MGDKFDLPARYRVLPCVVPFRIPGFLRHHTADSVTFAPREIACEEWFGNFADRVLASVGKCYLPVCRLSDGEFTVLLGEQPRHLLHPLHQRLRLWARAFGRRLLRRRVDFATRAGVSSGSYRRNEIRTFRKPYGEYLVRLAEKGILALHLSYGPVPFQEQFFPAFKQWLAASRLELTPENYVPFYFVYALLTGPRRAELLAGKRVLLVNSASLEKRERIEASLRKEGVRAISWCPISAARSFYDRMDVSPWRGKIDLALVGAGVGKPNILLQLEPLGVPTIDAGFVFEVWADPELRWHRPVCVPDYEYDPAKVRFLPPGFSPKAGPAQPAGEQATRPC